MLVFPLAFLVDPIPAVAAAASDLYRAERDREKEVVSEHVQRQRAEKQIATRQQAALDV